MRRFCAAIEKPYMANMVRGGKTPILPPEQLERIGFKIAAYPVMLLSAAIAAMRQALASLGPNATVAPPPQVSFEVLKEIVGFPEYYRRESRYATAG